MPDAKTIRDRLRAELAKLKAENAPRERIDAEIAEAQEAIDTISAQDPERQHQPSLIEKVLTTGIADPRAIENATNTWGLGAPGVIADAIAPGTYAGNREARTQRRESMPAAMRVGSEMAGSVFSPANNLIRAAQGAGRLARGGAAAADAGIQAGVTGTLNNLDDLSLEGAGNALKKGGKSALWGAGIAAPVGALAGAASRTAQRVGNTRRLDKQALEIDDRIRAMDDKNYSASRGEATSTPPITAILNDDPVMAPIAKEIRELAAYQGKKVTDAEVAMRVYTRLSADERRIIRAMDNADDFRPELSDELVERIGTAKQKLLAAVEAPTQVTTMGRAKSIAPPSVSESAPPVDLRDALNRHKTERAVGMWKRADVRGNQPGETVAQSRARQSLDRRIVEGRAPQTTGQPTPRRLVTSESKTFDIGPGIPSLRKAIDAKRVAEGERGAWERGSDVARSLGAGKVLRGKDFKTESKAAYLREVAEMTQQEAQLALSAFLGRGAETVRASNNPIGFFGLASSAARLPITMFRTKEVVRALEAKAGIKLSDEAFARFVRGATAKTVGAEAGR